MTATFPTSLPALATLLERADAVGSVLEVHAARHDAEGSYVDEGLAALRDAGLLRMAVPPELGGDGATPREVAAVQRALAQRCGSTALSSTMHQHVVSFTAWRYRRGLPGAEATLRRVADEGIFLASTGGADATHPRGEATKVEGGYRVTGRKVFVSGASRAAVMSTMTTYDDPEQGRRVLNVSIPFAADGVSVPPTWDAMGMRGTGSDDVVLDDVFVPDERVLANRPWGTIDGPLQVIFSIAMPIIAATYLGVAEAAQRAATLAVANRAADPIVQRQVGLMAHRIRIASWAVDKAFDEIGDDPQPSMDRFVAAMAAKREVAVAGLEVADLAMALVGGAAYRKGSVVERCARDLRAATFHPMTPEGTLVHAGRHALGLPTDHLV